MNTYFSPFPYFWAAAAAINILIFVFTFKSSPYFKANLRAFSLALTFSPALIVAGGHSGGGAATVPLLFVVLMSYLSPGMLIFFALNSIQFLGLWAALAFLFRRILRSTKNQNE